MAAISSLTVYSRQGSTACCAGSPRDKGAEPDCMTPNECVVLCLETRPCDTLCSRSCQVHRDMRPSLQMQSRGPDITHMHYCRRLGSFTDKRRRTAVGPLTADTVKTHRHAEQLELQASRTPPLGTCRIVMSRLMQHHRLMLSARDAYPTT